MKKVTMFLGLAFFAVGIMTTQQSCKNECKDVVCENGGTCNEDDGSCACVTGYEGTNCETEARTKFISNYELTDACDANKYESNVTTSAGDVEHVLISNMANVFIASTEGHITNSTDITIDSQEPDGDDWWVEGTGSISNGVITLSYTVTDPQNSSTTCSTTWTQK